jgi:uncharacterized alpha-E superfamily protein
MIFLGGPASPAAQAETRTEPMLSRVADALFWTARYLERAEHVARLIDVGFHWELDFAGVSPEAQAAHWKVLAAILQQPERADEAALDPDFAERFVQSLAFDPANPDSIVSCIAKARNNARSVRGAIGAEMWTELNALYWKLEDREFRTQARESPHDFFSAVESGARHWQGVCDATMTRDEGWHFLQLGRFLERADKTLRILDASFAELSGPARTARSAGDSADLHLANLQWASVLRSCAAYHAFQRQHVGRIDADRVAAFLLLNPQSPRSVRFAFEATAKALTGIEGPGGRLPGRSDRLLGRMLSDLDYVELRALIGANGLHAFVADLLERVGMVGAAVQDQYALP